MTIILKSSIYFFQSHLRLIKSQLISKLKINIFKLNFVTESIFKKDFFVLPVLIPNYITSIVESYTSDFLYSYFKDVIFLNNLIINKWDF